MPPWEKYQPVPSTAAKKNNADVALKGAAVEDIPLDRASKRMSIATGAASLAKAPIDRARSGVALDVDQATKDATIRKALADADSAEYTAKVNALKSKYPQMTAEQTLAGARAELMSEGDKAYRSARKFNPGSLSNLAAGALDIIPGIGAPAANLIRDPDSQMAINGRKQFTEGATRSLTGAGLRGDERTYSESEFFPQPFESPAVKAQKERLRKKYLERVITAAGPAFASEDAPSSAAGGHAIPPDLMAQYKSVPFGNKAAAKKRIQAAGYDVSGLD